MNDCQWGPPALCALAPFPGHPLYGQALAEALKRAREQRFRDTFRFAEPWPGDVKKELHAVYKKVREPDDGMGCMEACFAGLQVLYKLFPKYPTKDRGSLREKVWDRHVASGEHNDVKLIMKELQEQGLAGQPLVVSPTRNGTRPSADQAIGEMIGGGTGGGFYFIGLSVGDGHHTVLLAVDATQPGKTPQVFWLDQHSRDKGMTRNVTGKLDGILAEYDSPSQLYPLRPTATPK